MAAQARTDSYIFSISVIITPCQSPDSVHSVHHALMRSQSAATLS